MSYRVFITKENDRLLVKALECLLCHTEDANEKESIEVALAGLRICRPIEWENPKNLYACTSDSETPQTETGATA